MKFFLQLLINKKSLICFLLILFSFTAFPQVGFNNPNPDSSALIDMKANDKGLLIPRMTTAERGLMSANGKKVAHALLVFDLDRNMFFVYDTIANPDRWLALNPWLSKGDGSSDITTANNGKVGIGITPTEKLDVNGNIKSSGNVMATGNLIGANASLTGELTSNSISTGNINSTGNISTVNINSTGTVTANKLIGEGTMPAGAIILWSGTTPPTGWALCNGLNGTPDLRGKFIVGYDPADVDYNNPGNKSNGGAASGNTGGEKKHALTNAEMPRHNHTYANAYEGGGTGWRGGNSGGGGYYGLGVATTQLAGGDTSSSTEGPGVPHENRPPYYTLAYIMKLPY